MSKFQSPTDRRMPIMTNVVRHWAKHYADAWPNLPASLIGWGEPFCFRCGWLAPVPTVSTQARWEDARGWLERAHLHDHMTGGVSTPDNIGLLCQLCHRAMPDFPDSREDAVAWVGGQDHNSCPAWWQLRTDSMWSGENYRSFPGRLAFINSFFTGAEANQRADVAVECALRGDYAGARQNMLLAGLAPRRITDLLSRFVNERALERAGAA